MCNIIDDKQRVAKSKQLPFRFYNAFKNVTDQNLKLAVANALEHSLGNVPSFDGKILVAVDGSGSMNGSCKSGLTPIQKASLFAAALFKKNDVDLVLYDTQLYRDNSIFKGDSMMTIADKIIKRAPGGGTATSLVFQYANQSRIPYSRIIILSDDESWCESWAIRDSVQAQYENYRKYNDCPVFAIDIEGYGTKDVTGSKVHHVAGFSDKIFDFMRIIENKENILDAIENYQWVK